MRTPVYICSVSGGIDSTALYLLMQKFHGENFVPVFADTGHEHPVTVNYVRNLHYMAKGPKVNIIQADFVKPLEKKRLRLLRGRNYDTVDQVRKNYRMSFKMKASGNAFLDMMLWKGRAPSSKAQFCTEHVKLWPILFWLERNYPRDQFEWIMHTGIRNEESAKRAKIINHFSWNDFYECMSVMPLLQETRVWEFEYLEEKGVPPNPLYTEMAQPRVGCFPCIHSNKPQLASLPEWAWGRLAFYESMLERSWFPSGIIPGKPDGYIPTIQDVREWAKTTHGGRQYDMFKSGEVVDAPSCMTGWIACE
jgi:3'-phosphoadenosine 5'-phosphosulfate sulfotransferase (PAPS reductase)/FAD synthetase